MAEPLFQKIKIALLAFGPIGIFLLGITDSLGIPLPGAMDGLVLYIAVKEPSKAYFTALMAVCGSLIGNVGLFWTARHGSRWLIKAEPAASSRRGKFQQWFARYGLLTVFIPAVTPIVPLPLKVFVISAGALHTNFGKFVLVILVARVIRLFGEAYLGIQLGEDAEAFLRRNAWPLLVAAMTIAVGIYFAIRFNERRGDPL